jgi:hypothetical protein
MWTMRKDLRYALLGGALCAAALISQPASATPICASATSCTLNLDIANSSSGIGSGNWGTVGLSLSGTTVTVTVMLTDSSWELVKTGFPGVVGFHDSLGGGLTIDNFSSSAYSGGSSMATDTLHFDGFGYVNDAAATTGPHAGSSHAVSTLSFDVSGAGLTNVNDLVNWFSPAGGDGNTLFAVDVWDSQLGSTGLIGADGTTVSHNPPPNVPEPATLALFGAAIAGFGALRRRRK